MQALNRRNKVTIRYWVIGVYYFTKA